MTTYFWASATSGNWKTTGVGYPWTPSGGPPTALDNATISVTGSSTYLVQVTTADVANVLTLSSGNADLQIFAAAGHLTAASFTMSAGKVDVGTSGSAAGLFSVNGAFNLSTGTVNLNNGGTLALGGTLTEMGGTINLKSGATISGGTIKQTAGTFNITGGTLSGVTFAGPLTLSAAQLHLTNNTQVVGSSGAGPGTINARGGGAYLFYDGTQTISNTTINLGTLDSTTTDVIYANSSSTGDETLTLAANTIVNLGYYAEQIIGGYGNNDQLKNLGVINDVQTLTSYNYISGNNVDNEGTINAKTADDLLYINASSFTNAGAIDVAGGGNVTIVATTFLTTASSVLTVEANSNLYITPTDDWTNLGSITLGSGAGVYIGGHSSAASLGSVTNSGGTMFIAGTYDNSGHTLDGSASFGALALASGTISGGTVTAAGLQINGNNANGTLSGVTFDGPLTLSAYNTQLHLSNNTQDLSTQVVGASGTGPGTINVGGGNSYLYYDGTQTITNTTINLGTLDSSTTDVIYFDSSNTGNETLTLATNTTVNLGYYAEQISGGYGPNASSKI